MKIMKGYHGKILVVNLSKKKNSVLEIREDWYKAYIGGAGLGARLLWNNITASLDPFSEEAVLLFMTGPFTGTKVPSGSRYVVVGLSAIGIYGESSSGGHFGPAIKKAGFDGILVTGKSEEPIYLWINNESVEIRSAKHIWGKTTYETQEIIKDEIGEKTADVAAIGPAGENLVKFAGIFNGGGRAAGRTGLGAVMGSKKLKAIAAWGDKKVELANEEKFDEAVKQALLHQISSPGHRLMGEYGTRAYTDVGAIIGDTPVKYYTTTVYPYEMLSGVDIMAKYPHQRYACYGCPIGCGAIISYNRRGVTWVDAPEYETIAALGPLCGNYDADSIIYANYLANALGMDTISLGSTIAFTIYLYEKGVLNESDVGMQLAWGDHEAIIRLINITARREGFGAVIAEGVRELSKRFNVSSEEAAHVKGLEIPMHDPRAFFGEALTYATASRGASHLEPDWYSIDSGALIQEIGVFPGDRFNMDNRIAMFVKFQNFRELFQALILCKFISYPATDILNMFNAITGWHFSMDEFVKAGERMFNLKRAINNIRGITRKDDYLPKIVIAPLHEGPTGGKSPDLEEMLKKYYEIRKWDWVTGKPKQEKLEELGLSFVNTLFS